MVFELITYFYAEDISQLQEKLFEQKLEFKEIESGGVAFHSPLVTSASEDFLTIMSSHIDFFERDFPSSFISSTLARAQQPKKVSTYCFTLSCLDY